MLSRLVSHSSAFAVSDVETGSSVFTSDATFLFCLKSISLCSSFLKATEYVNGSFSLFRRCSQEKPSVSQEKPEQPPNRRIPCGGDVLDFYMILKGLFTSRCVYELGARHTTKMLFNCLPCPGTAQGRRRFTSP